MTDNEDGISDTAPQFEVNYDLSANVDVHIIVPLPYVSPNCLIPHRTRLEKAAGPDLMWKCLSILPKNTIFYSRQLVIFMAQIAFRCT